MEIQQLEFLKHVLQFRRRVYLDHNATTPVSGPVRRKMNHVLKHHYGNPSSFYGAARKAAGLMEQARQQGRFARLARPGEHDRRKLADRLCQNGLKRTG